MICVMSERSVKIAHTQLKSERQRKDLLVVFNIAYKRNVDIHVYNVLTHSVSVMFVHTAA